MATTVRLEYASGMCADGADIESPHPRAAVAPSTDLPLPHRETPSPIAPYPERVRWFVPLVFVVVMVGLVATYLALSVPGRWIKSSQPRTFEPAVLSVTTGTVVQAGARALRVAPEPDSGAVIVSLKFGLRAIDYPGVAWDVSGLPPGTQARLLWRTDVKPDRTFSLDVPIAAGRTLPVVALDNPDWFGGITGIALALKLPPESAPVRIAGVTALPLSAGGILAARWREWTTFEPWTGASINSIVGGADVQELPPVLLLGLGLALVTAVSVAIAGWRPAFLGPGLPAVLGALFLGAWWLLDVRWESNLLRQAAVTAGQYAGKSLEAKHLAAEDAALYAFIEKARAALPAPPVRVFVAADEHYFRGRAAYHLYPQNVFWTPDANLLPPPGALRSGDFLVIFERRGVEYDRAQRSLRWEGMNPVAAELVLANGGGAVFRIL